MVPVIIDGLKKLEYRGYDSAGIAVAGNGAQGDHIAVRRGCDVDQPRNLAKSVTVE